MTPNIWTDLNRPYIPESGTTLTAKIDVDPGEQQEPVERHIALCIDTSGSMTKEDKIDRARDGARWVFGLLDEDDYISITAFDSEAELVLRPTRWGDIPREKAMAAVEDLTAGGGTDMYDGIDTAQNSLIALKHRNESDGMPVKRILLLSDGEDMEHDAHEFAEIAEEVDESGIRILAAGIGEEYNEDTIRTLGTTARGEWTHLEKAGDIEDFFGDAVEQASEVVASDAQLELDVAPGVEVSEVYRSLPQAQHVDLDWEDNTAIVPLPDLTERMEQRVVLKIHVPAQTANEDEVALAEITLTANGGEASELISVEYTDDNEKLAAHKEDVQLDHQQTVIKTELGKGNVEEAETQVEKMTRIHGEETEIVQEAQRETELVKEGGRAERNRATKIVSDDEGVQK